MKKIKILRELLVFCFILFCNLNISGQLINNQTQPKNKNFVLTGKLIGQLHGYVSLSYINSEGKQIKDSSLLQKGAFYFKGNIHEPTVAILRGSVNSIADDDPNAAGFFLEPDKMTAIAEKNNFKKIKITGSHTQKENEMLQKECEGIDNSSDSAYEAFSNLSYQFIYTHPNSYVSVFQLALYETRWPLDTVRMLYNGLNPKIRKSFYGKDIAESINEIDNNLPGKIAKPFTAININGQSINLSDFKGKYVLLDFWASWCVPCRQGNPHLIELFKRYHDRGLDWSV